MSLMKVMLDVKDEKAPFFIELIRHLPFVKNVKSMSPAKSKVLEELKEAIDNLNLVKAGKLKAQPARELLDEL